MQLLCSLFISRSVLLLLCIEYNMKYVTLSGFISVLDDRKDVLLEFKTKLSGTSHMVCKYFYLSLDKTCLRIKV